MMEKQKTGLFLAHGLYNCEQFIFNIEYSDLEIHHLQQATIQKDKGQEDTW
jgi:hypothetical protein